MRLRPPKPVWGIRRTDNRKEEVVIKTILKRVNMIKSDIDKCLLLLFLPGHGILYMINGSVGRRLHYERSVSHYQRWFL